MSKTASSRIYTGLLVVAVLLLSVVVFRPRTARAQDSGRVVVQETEIQNVSAAFPIVPTIRPSAYLPAGWHVVGFSCTVEIEGKQHCFIATANKGN